MILVTAIPLMVMGRYARISLTISRYLKSLDSFGADFLAVFGFLSLRLFVLVAAVDCVPSMLRSKRIQSSSIGEGFQYGGIISVRWRKLNQTIDEKENKLKKKKICVI